MVSPGAMLWMKRRGRGSSPSRTLLKCGSSMRGGGLWALFLCGLLCPDSRSASKSAKSRGDKRSLVHALALALLATPKLFMFMALRVYVFILRVSSSFLNIFTITKSSPLPFERRNLRATHGDSIYPSLYISCTQMHARRECAMPYQKYP